MIIKKLILTMICSLIFYASVTLPTYAAKPANLNNKQIVSKVKQFNNSRLVRLNDCIKHTGIDSKILRDLINLYKRLDNLVVPNIIVACDLTAPANVYDNYSIGSQLAHLCWCLIVINNNDNKDITNVKTYTPLAELRAELTKTHAELVIESLNDRLDNIEFSNNKNNK